MPKRSRCGPRAGGAPRVEGGALRRATGKMAPGDAGRCQALPRSEPASPGNASGRRCPRQTEAKLPGTSQGAAGRA